MCGIIGYVNLKGHIEKYVLDEMARRLAHRGPDGEGSWVSACGKVGLAHRRLSIIDLSDMAAQPMHDSKSSVTIVFNGEIYNHRELRRSLEKEGVHFRTDHSDTETLLQGYIAWGLKVLIRRLIGMFAFIIYDATRNRMYVVRDRLGVKPIYMTRHSGAIFFASEAKALFAHPGLEAKLDHRQFYHYLSFRSVVSPATLFDGIEKLGPGELVELDVTSGAIHRDTYWNPLDTAASEWAGGGDVEDVVEQTLVSSVHYRLESDVPVGVFLSGGIDSAYLLRVAAAQLRDIDTFTVTYPGYEEYDEGVVARKLAKDERARHHEVPVTSDDFVGSLAAVAYFQDEPIAAPVCLPIFLLAAEAKKAKVPVVLSGEGSDELFIGYTNWLRLRDLQRLDHCLPDLPGRLLRRGAAALASHMLSPFSRYPEFIERAANGQPLFWGGALDFTTRAKEYLLGPSVRAKGVDTYEEVIRPIYEEYLRCRPASDITGWMSYIDIKFRLPELMLPRLDKMCMASSVEGRVPFLDHRLVELVMRLPRQYRSARGYVGKPLFKSIASRLLGDEFVYRRKQGFQAPVKEWKASHFGSRYLPALMKFSDRTGLLNTMAVEQLLKHSGDRLYFSLLNFMMWYLVYIDNVLHDEFPDLSLKPWLSNVA